MWKPYIHDVQECPLALCDGSAIRVDDLLIVGPHQVVQIVRYDLSEIDPVSPPGRNLEMGAPVFTCRQTKSEDTGTRVSGADVAC
jgi:hypothetical protein